MYEILSDVWNSQHYLGSRQGKKNVTTCQSTIIRTRALSVIMIIIFASYSAESSFSYLHATIDTKRFIIPKLFTWRNFNHPILLNVSLYNDFAVNLKERHIL